MIILTNFTPYRRNIVYVVFPNYGIDPSEETERREPDDVRANTDIPRV